MAETSVEVRKAFGAFGVGYEVRENGKLLGFVRYMRRTGWAKWLHKPMTRPEAQRAYAQLKSALK